MKPDNKVLLSHSDTMELPCGTKLKITVEKYEKPIYPMGEPMYIMRKVEYVKKRGARFVDVVSDLKDEEALKEEVRVMIESINKNPDLFRYQHAPK